MPEIALPKLDSDRRLLAPKSRHFGRGTRPTGSRSRPNRPGGGGKTSLRLGAYLEPPCSQPVLAGANGGDWESEHRRPGFAVPGRNRTQLFTDRSGSAPDVSPRSGASPLPRGIGAEGSARVSGAVTADRDDAAGRRRSPAGSLAGSPCGGAGAHVEAPGRVCPLLPRPAMRRMGPALRPISSGWSWAQ